MPNATRDTFRFSRIALGIQTQTAAQKLVLLTLAVRTNGKTCSCHPSYESLCHDTGLSKSTVALAVRYLRDDLKILDWTKGHSNQYTKPLANMYTLDYARMEKLSQDGAVLSPVSELSKPCSEYVPRTQRAEVAESDSRVAESDSGVARSDLGVAESDGRTPTTIHNYQDTTTKHATGAAPVSKNSNTSINTSTCGQKGHGEAAQSIAARPDGFHKVKTFDELRAKLDHYRKHGGCEPEEYRALQQQVEALEAKAQEAPSKKTG